MRLLVDSANWIDHLRRPGLHLARALKERRALIHPSTIGEIALGSLHGTVAAGRAHLLAATMLTPKTRLWTRDRRVQPAAGRLGIAATEPVSGVS